MPHLPPILVANPVKVQEKIKEMYQSAVTKCIDAWRREQKRKGDSHDDAAEADAAAAIVDPCEQLLKLIDRMAAATAKRIQKAHGHGENN